MLQPFDSRNSFVTFRGSWICTEQFSNLFPNLLVEIRNCGSYPSICHWLLSERVIQSNALRNSPFLPAKGLFSIQFAVQLEHWLVPYFVKLIVCARTAVVAFTALVPFKAACEIFTKPGWVDEHYSGKLSGRFSFFYRGQRCGRLVSRLLEQLKWDESKRGRTVRAPTLWRWCSCWDGESSARILPVKLSSLIVV